MSWFNRANRYLKRSLVESPWITVTAVLTTVGVAMPTYSYFAGGKEKEQKAKFSLSRELKRDPRQFSELDAEALAAQRRQDAQRTQEQYLADRKAAAGH